MFAASARTAKAVPVPAPPAQTYLILSRHCSGENSMINIFSSQVLWFAWCLCCSTLCFLNHQQNLVRYARKRQHVALPLFNKMKVVKQTNSIRIYTFIFIWHCIHTECCQPLVKNIDKLNRHRSVAVESDRCLWHSKSRYHTKAACFVCL